jgi:hypothetical protein
MLHDLFFSATLAPAYRPLRLKGLTAKTAEKIAKFAKEAVLTP